MVRLKAAVIANYKPIDVVYENTPGIEDTVPRIYTHGHTNVYFINCFLSLDVDVVLVVCFKMNIWSFDDVFHRRNGPQV